MSFHDLFENVRYAIESKLHSKPLDLIESAFEGPATAPQPSSLNVAIWEAVSMGSAAAGAGAAVVWQVERFIRQHRNARLRQLAAAALVGAAIGAGLASLRPAKRAATQRAGQKRSAD